uniref:Succinate dehydrogenase [ubiquinone] cytochrome b small subunit n=1 Tax=Craspedostauros australis TaxID=1486917 RepID=A0A7R9WPI3_9STRA|mmetsp:Transcript_13186/g.36420  ORF Transcript_13186/g.36420 Transcript_13186/m.36420 type:complete len:156 (+) Transcript_13186:204-671(+)
MIRSFARSSVLHRSRLASRAALSRGSARNMSTKSAIEGDAGALATHAHHTMTTALAVATPVFFLVPDAYTDGIVNKIFGLGLSVNIAAHSWVGMNYVVTDYVPKISKSLTGPARIFNVGLAAITMLGLGRISLSSKGGIKGCLKGLWNPPTKDDK